MFGLWTNSLSGEFFFSSVQSNHSSIINQSHSSDFNIALGVCICWIAVSCFRLLRDIRFSRRTPSLTDARSPSAEFAVSNSARTVLKQRQFSFSSDVDGLDTPSSTSLSMVSDVITQSNTLRNLPAGVEISHKANSLTVALNSIATVNQAVVQTLRELKTGKSSSSNTRFPIDKILPYEGKCQLGDSYTSRPVAWCTHFRDKALAFQVDDKLWTVFALLASSSVVSHR